jgi:hypothetical protein
MSFNLSKFMPFKAQSSMASIQSQLSDHQYEARRLCLIHTSAAEQYASMVGLCIERAHRLGGDLRACAAFTVEKRGLFRRVSIGKLIADQVHQNHLEQLLSASQEEHHRALAVMYAARIARLQLQLQLSEIDKVSAVSINSPVLAEKTVAEPVSVHPHPFGKRSFVPEARVGSMALSN